MLCHKCKKEIKPLCSFCKTNKATSVIDTTKYCDLTICDSCIKIKDFIKQNKEVFRGKAVIELSLIYGIRKPIINEIIDGLIEKGMITETTYLMRNKE